MYVMYYVEGDRILEMNSCLPSGDAKYSWASDPLLAPIPPEVDRLASLPD